MMIETCPTCHYAPCQCVKRGWAQKLSPETHARGEMVRRNLPWGTFLGGELMRRDAEIERLESVEPTHLPPDKLLELYCLELIEALKSERAKRGN